MKVKNVKQGLYLLAFIFTVICISCCLNLPMSASALTKDDITDLAGGKHYYYVDGNEDDQWVYTNGEWEHCDIVDNSDNLSAVTSSIRKEMINRNNSITLYIATKSDEYNEKVSETMTAEDLSTKYIKKIFDGIVTDVYKTDGITDNLEKAKSGMYLDMNTLSITSTNESGRLRASDTGEYSYFKLCLNITYSSTALEEQRVDEFIQRWQKDFISSNELIKSQTNINKKNYYIVKTIYNFLSDNTLYDYNVKKNEDGSFGPETQQYKNSHTAYGAIFGKTVDEDNVVDTALYDYTVYTDSTGLTRIKKQNQGLSVCDGYSLFTYYLCRLNGIECDIVNGDYTADSGIGSDPHAWNLIKLYPCVDSVQNPSEAKWYYFDATYSATSPISLRLDSTINSTHESVNIVDYSYFLRGTSNRAFDTISHQQLYSAAAGLDENDYYLDSPSIEASGSWVILTRRIDADKYLEVENYFIISPEQKYYKIDSETFELVECENDIDYNGSSYYYNINIQDFVNGIEYTCPDKNFKDSGSYSFKAVSIDGTKDIYTLSFDIAPLDMSDWKGYQHFMWGDGATTKDLKDTDLSQAANVEFRGTPISFTVEIQDVAGQKLTEFTNYIIKYKDDNGEIDAPYLPGNYCIEIDFDKNDNDNYAKVLRIPFSITKGDFSKFQISPIGNVPFGADILGGCNVLKLQNSDIILKRGIDYEVSLENPNAINYGDFGNVIYTALDTSGYIQAGTRLYRPYSVEQLNVSELYNGKPTNSKYVYTGSAITPTDFKLYMNINGTVYQLEPGKDYTIVSYRNNINPGTGYVAIQFAGRFCGQAEMSFEICLPEQQPNDNQSNQQLPPPQVSVNVQDNLTYNGAKQTPYATVTVNGAVLTQGIDYTVSTLPSGTGVYECTIQGLGQYSYITYKTAVFVNPAKVTGGRSKGSSATTVTIGWNGQGENCYYQVYTYDAKRKKWVHIATTDATSFKTSYYINNGKKLKLKSNTQYRFKVRAYFSVSINGTVYSKYGDFTNINGATKITTPASPKVKKGKKSFNLSWKRTANASGYEIVYATDSKYKKSKKVYNVSKGKTTSAAIKKLKAGKTYYVKIRAYQKVNGKKVYSAYSKTLKIKV